MLGDALGVRRDVVAFLREAHRRYGDLFGVRIGRRPIVVLAHPDDFRQVLLSDHASFDRATRTTAVQRDITGESVLTTEGEAWRERRKTLSPTFRPDRIAAAAPRLTATLHHAVDRLLGADDEARDLHPWLMRTTLDVILTMVGGERATAGEDIDQALVDVLDHNVRRLQSPWDLPHRLPSRSRARFRRGMRRIDDFVRHAIDLARSDPERPLLARLADADGAAPGPERVRDEAVTLLLAGHETTANALAWCCALLARHPGWQERIRDEARAVLDDGSDIERLEIAGRVFREALRLYPPIWLMERRARIDVAIGGCSVPAGTSVMPCPLLAQRHPALWETPDAFDPDRFAPEAIAARPRHHFLPFGLGPHRCLGEHLSLLEGRLILALLLQRRRLEPVDQAMPAMRPLITLRPAAPVRVRLRPW